MKQLLQNIKSGEVELADVPSPKIKPGMVLVHTSRTLISAGTERMMVDFGKANFIDKARQQPDKVRMVLDKVKTDGLLPTVDAVRSKLDYPLAPGYCNAGVVVGVGEGVSGFSVGDRVASNGKHAEMVSVPANLCAKIPDGVDDESAAFTVAGAIALQGIRLAGPTLGETVVVTGLGLIGLLTVQLLRAHGCRVIGIDLDHEKLKLAESFGAETVNIGSGQDPVPPVHQFSRGRGADAVIVTASAKSSEPMHQAARMCRKRGRIILVGVTGLELSRADFYEKELTFQVSCSYGPGRYDPNYEEKGQDYPVGFVRWTEQRNFEAVLDMMADGRPDVKPLISHRFPIDRAGEAYELLSGKEPYMGIMLEYPERENANERAAQQTVCLNDAAAEEALKGAGSDAAVGFIGAGNYAGRTLMPAFQKAGAVLHTVASGGGVSGVHFGRKYGFLQASTDASELLGNDRINTVVVATPHNSHAKFVLDALNSGKHVFVEKPLCISHDELIEIKDTYLKLKTEGLKAPLLMVGFNRRFSPQVKKIKELTKGTKSPKSFVITVNAGEIPPDHWTQDAETGGGRIIGEACHFIDLLRFLAGCTISNSDIKYMDSQTNDTATIQLAFADGSIGAIHYFANGSKSFPKERLEVFAEGGVLQLDNFRRLKGFGWPGFRKMNLMRQDKGQGHCVATFVEAVKQGKTSPIPFEELVEVAKVTIDLAERARR